MRIAVLVDDMRVTRWQAAALRALGGKAELRLYNCRNSRGSPRRLAHALYYALNLFTIRNPQTRSMAIGDAGVGAVERFDFDSEYDGAWQRLPAALLDKVRADAPDAIVKFGMGLLRIPPETELAAPILSYHHGDPSAFRGRPAGFYESLSGTPVMGQIVQILSNRLDAGQVLAFAQTKVHPHSYRQTLVEAYSHSPLLLGKALDALRRGATLGLAPTGRAYRLPGNGTVLRFLARLAMGGARRLLYGAFVEKAWRVSTAALAPDDVLHGQGLAGTGTPLPTPRGYTFLADPFFHPSADGFLVEAMNARSGRGEILHLRDGAAERLSDPGVHISYPAGIAWEGDHYVVPEISEWGSARIFRLTSSGLADHGALDIPGAPRLLDPTLHAGADALYLFANDAAEGPHVLRLWMAASLFGRFEEHPASPVLISPLGGRMAGDIVRAGPALYRLGQNGGAGYGEGVLIHRIEALSPAAYTERPVGEIRLGTVKGPHTLNFRGGEAVFDWYSDRVSLAAGMRRLGGRLSRR